MGLQKVKHDWAHKTYMCECHICEQHNNERCPLAMIIEIKANLHVTLFFREAKKSFEKQEYQEIITSFLGEPQFMLTFADMFYNAI